MIDSHIRRRIDDRLAEIEREESVRILLAVESGSRAWGFPSPDSDYDIRFLYVRPRDWYLALDKRRDVIEYPVEDLLDINGWDIKKALQLLLRANPVLSEWLVSPIRYRENENCVRRLRDLAARTRFRRSARYHYLHLGRSSYRKELAGRETIRLKKYFYSLRPALALRWLRSSAAMLPMDLPTLMAGLDLVRELREAIDELIARKAERSEIGTGARVGVIDRFIEEELAAAERGGEPDGGNDPALWNDANAAFRDIVAGGL